MTAPGNTPGFRTIDYTIGNTPLVRLQRLPEAGTSERGVVILGKLEGNNPGGSVKDRPVLSMIRHAEARGEIRPGDRLIEATSGNTGIAMAGYRMTLIMPDNLSAERRASMTAYGAELILTPAAAGGMEYARDLAMEMQRNDGGRVLDQFAADGEAARRRGEDLPRSLGGRCPCDCAAGGGGAGACHHCVHRLRSRRSLFEHGHLSRLTVVAHGAEELPHLALQQFGHTREFSGGL